MLIGFEDEGEDEGAGDPAAEGAADNEESRREFEVTTEATPTLPPTTAEAAPRTDKEEPRLNLPQQSARLAVVLRYCRTSWKQCRADGSHPAR